MTDNTPKKRLRGLLDLLDREGIIMYLPPEYWDLPEADGQPGLSGVEDEE
jgi:hypothetical protein